VVQSNVSPDALAHFMEILDGLEPHFPLETLNDLILRAREFGHNILTASLAPQRDTLRPEENIHVFLQKFDRKNRSTTIETDFQSHCAWFAVMHCLISAIAEGFDGMLEIILSELEKIAQLVKRPSKKHSSDQRVFIETLIKWIVVKSISFHSINARSSSE
jgi:hypothetical protein